MPIGSGCLDAEKSSVVGTPVMQLDNFALTMSWEPQGHLVSNAFFKRNPSRCDYFSIERGFGPYVPGWELSSDVGGFSPPSERLMPINHIDFCYAYRLQGRKGVSPLIAQSPTRGPGPEFPSYFFIPNTLSSLVPSCAVSFFFELPCRSNIRISSKVLDRCQRIPLNVGLSR